MQQNSLIGRLNSYFSLYFETFSVPTAQTLFLLVLSILALESAHSIRFVLSEEIRQQIFFAGFVKTAENSIKSQRILRALKQLIYRQGYHL